MATKGFVHPPETRNHNPQWRIVVTEGDDPEQGHKVYKRPRLYQALRAVRENEGDIPLHHVDGTRFTIRLQA